MRSSDVERRPRLDGGQQLPTAAAGRHAAATWTLLPLSFLAIAIAGSMMAVLLLARESLPFLDGGLSRGQIYGRDFAVFWFAGVLAWQGELGAIFDAGAFSEAFASFLGEGAAFHGFPYPPHGLWTVLPLAALPYGPALASWMAGSFCLFLWAALGGRRPKAVDLGLLLLAPAAMVNIAVGQNGFLSGALMLGGWRLLDRRPVLAGILFGLLSYKPQIGLLLPVLLIADRRWRAFSAAAATVLLLLAASLLAAPDAWHLYLDSAAALQKRFLETGTGMFTAMVPSVFMAARLMELPLGAAYALQAVVAVAFAIACYSTVRRFRPPPERQALLAATGAFLLSPYGFNYDMPMIAGAVLWLLRSRPVSTGDGAILGAVWLLPVAMMPQAWLLLVPFARFQSSLMAGMLPDGISDLLVAPLLAAPILTKPLGELHLPFAPVILGLACIVALRHAARLDRDAAQTRTGCGDPGCDRRRPSDLAPGTTP